MLSGSSTLNGLREFNNKNKANLEQMSEYMKQKKLEMDEAGSDSSGFESVDRDSQCESYHSGDEEDVEMKDESKPVDNDGFEQVQEKRRRR